MHNGHKQNGNEAGMASIFVVMILMTILSLISIGFSHLMNREARQALDRQLSTQAFYAAESGVNDARDYLASGGASFSGCVNWPNRANSFFAKNGDISGDQLSKYSCLSINTTPKELDYQVNPGQSIVIKLSGSNLSALSKLFLSWENSAPYGSSGPQPLGTCTVGVSTGCNTPQESGLGADSTGLLRVGVYPVVASCNDTDDHGNRFNRYSGATDAADATLECASRNYFLYPNSAIGSPNTVDYTNAFKDGSFVLGNCNPAGIKPQTDFSNQETPRYCSSEINNLYPATGTAGNGQANSYYLRLTAEYKALNVSIIAADSSPIPKALAVANAEGIIDSTGTGNDVLRRVQARVPLQNNLANGYGLQSMESVCKLFRVPVNNPGFYDQATLDGSAFSYSDVGNCTFPQGGNDIRNEGLGPINLPPPPIAHISASPNPVLPGSNTTLTWNSTDADFCSGSGFNIPNGDTSGSVVVGPINADTTFGVTCTGSNGTGSDSVTVQLLQRPSCQVNANFSPDNGDGNTTINWSFSGGCSYFWFDEAGMNVFGNCTDASHCWVGGGGGQGITLGQSVSWTFNGGADPWGTLSTVVVNYSYSPPAPGPGPGPGPGPPPANCWDGNYYPNPADCPPQPICRPICFGFVPLKAQTLALATLNKKEEIFAW